MMETETLRMEDQEKESGFRAAPVLKDSSGHLPPPPPPETSTKVCSLGLGEHPIPVLEKTVNSDSAMEAVDSGSGGGGGRHRRSSTKEMFEKLYPEEETRPFHYSSSIYYGAQDVYFQPEMHTPLVPEVQREGGGGEDLDAAMRGNWWQGSLYY